MSKRLHHKPVLPKGDIQDLNVTFGAPAKASKPVSEKTERLIIERSLGIRRPEAFGTSENVEQIGFESLLPSLVKAEIPSRPPRVLIGNAQCRQPYDASMLNCSALSFGPLGKNFILAMNRAAKLGEFFQNTGEAGLSPYHFGVDVDIESPDFDADGFFDNLKNDTHPELQEAGDVVWQIGNGYFGCRRANGSFDPLQFEKKATLRNVKMIEVKLSQGVEPCKNMPVKQVTTGIAKLMGIQWGTQAALQDEHSSFSSPIELLRFIQQLRNLSGGKPIGLKVGISHRQYFLAICKAMRKTGIFPDFVTIDGMEAGTAASSQGAAGFTGTALNDAIVFVHNALVGTNLRKHIKIIASGRMFTEKDIVSKAARGADLCSTARGMLISVGCDQQLECYGGMCQRGIATQDPRLLRNFNVPQNTQRAFHYHRITIQELMELLSIAGVCHPSQLAPFHMQMRVSAIEVKTLEDVYEFLKPGALLTPLAWRIPKSYRKSWNLARPDAPFACLVGKAGR
jgi:glutamate synthase domain-containing protein 2